MGNNTFSEIFKNVYNEIKFIDDVVITSTKVTSPGENICEKDSFLKCRLMFVIKGLLSIKTEDSHIIASEGDIVYIPSGKGFSSSWSLGGECKYYLLTFVLYDGKFNLLKMSEDITVVSNDDYGDIFQHVKEINVLYAKKREEDIFFFKGEVYRLFGAMFKHLAEKEKTVRRTDDNSIAKAKLFLDENYTHNITIKMLAQMCNVSQSTFNRKFIKNYGLSPHKYIMDLKIKQAEVLLENEASTVAEIAEKLGFTDASHFNKMYKQINAITPRFKKDEKENTE